MLEKIQKITIMNLLIKIENNMVSALLSEKKSVIDQESFELSNNLTEKLLPTIDNLLKRNKMDIKDIRKADFECNVPNSYTTYRIGKVVVDTINWIK